MRARGNDRGPAPVEQGVRWSQQVKWLSQPMRNMKGVSAMKPTETSYPAARPEEQWREKLTPQEYHVLREAGTERPHTGEYTDTKDVGVYSCRACGAELFRSETKFDSHCGWPSFYAPLAQDRVEYLEDRSMGAKRVEVRCASCGSHLGHVFEGEGYGTPTDQRYCINSISLTMPPATE